MEISQRKIRDPEWWRAFFEGPFGTLQLGGAFDEKAPAEVDLISSWVGSNERLHILDAPTGNGRIGLELARRGHFVTGIDFNPRVLEQGRRVAARDNLAIEFRLGDLRQLPFESEFDVALSWWSSYGYFSERENFEYLSGLARALGAGGKLVLDTLVAETLYPVFQERGWQDWESAEGKVRVLEERHFNLETSSVEVEWTFLTETERETHWTQIHVPTYRELCEVLRSVGFRSFSAFERPSGKPFRLGSPRLCLVAEK